MAEARNAVLVMAHKRGMGLRLRSSAYDDGIDITVHVPHPLAVLRGVKKEAARARNRVVDALFPANTLVLLVVMAIVVGVVVSADAQSWLRQGFLAQFLWWVDSRIGFYFLPRLVRVGILAAEASVGGFILLMVGQRALLRLLLSWQGWMYQAHGTSSLAVKVWGGAVQLLSGRHPQTYSFQMALPRQHVPAVKDTVARYLETVRPLLTPDVMAEVEEEAATFVSTQASKLQPYLRLKAWWASHYMTDWWEKYVYHRGRDSIMINSNYYVLDSSSGTPTPHQAARAANLSRQFAIFKRTIDHEALKPLLLRRTVPLCMNQYRRMFSTTRIPRREFDTLQQSSWSRHIAVLCRGHWFKLDLYTRGKAGTLASAPELESEFSRIIATAAELGNVTSSEGRLAALTAGERTRWANAREQHFTEGVNRASLDVIEQAMFVVVLDQERPTNWTEQGHMLLHGTGSNRWFDKSLTLVCFANGRAGLNCEHSWADAPVPAHMWETCVTSEVLPGAEYDEAGHTTGGRAHAPTGTPRGRRASSSASASSGTLAPAARLSWELNPALDADIEASMVEAQEAIADLQLEVFTQTAYGKGFMKRCKVSPDAFIQLALQLAYRRDSGEFTLCYESSMTRRYRNGRTETVRSVSAESCAFVNAMLEGEAGGGADSADAVAAAKRKIELFRAAAGVHQKKYRDAMSGEGVDRHLFALYVVSKGRDMNCPFLNRALSMPWKLSTSQQPQQQTTNWQQVSKIQESVKWWTDDSGRRLPSGPSSAQLFSPGGGFGPVAADGYGVSYMIVGNDQLYMHVTSKRSAPNTSSPRFRDAILKSFADIRALFDLVEGQ